MAAGEQTVEDVPRDGNVEQGELPEERETHGRLDLAGKFTADDLENEEGGRGAEPGRRDAAHPGPGVGLMADLKLLEVGQGSDRKSTRLNSSHPV